MIQHWRVRVCDGVICWERDWRSRWRAWRHRHGAGEIKIGEINSYSLLPAFTEPYRKGWQLAVEEINASGGINGKKLVVISKDDGGKPADAQTAANELVSSEKSRC